MNTKQQIEKLVDSANRAYYKATNDKYWFAQELLESRDIPATERNIEYLENLLES